MNLQEHLALCPGYFHPPPQSIGSLAIIRIEPSGGGGKNRPTIQQQDIHKSKPMGYGHREINVCVCVCVCVVGTVRTAKDNGRI